MSCLHASANVASEHVCLHTGRNAVAGLSCDEYPFASTEEGQLGHSVTRTLLPDLFSDDVYIMLLQGVLLQLRITVRWIPLYSVKML